jgi:uncharacterized membrane protein YkvI
MAWEAAIAALAAVVGAGFVSGREVFVFFAAHGPLGGALAAGAALLLALGAWRTAQTLPEVPSIRPVWRLMLGAFSFVTLSAVLASLGSLVQLRLGLPAAAGAGVAALIAAVLAKGGTLALRRWQGLLLIGVLFAVAVTASLGLWRLPRAPLPMSVSPLQAVLAVFGYAAYNIALASDGVRRSARGNGMHGPRGAFLGGLAAGLLLTLEAAVLAGSGMLVAHADLPLREVAMQLHGVLAAAVDGAIALASLSAAASFLQACADFLGGPYTTAAVAFLASTLGVQVIVDRAYPVMAALALLWILALLWPPALAGPAEPHGQGR